MRHAATDPIDQQSLTIRSDLHAIIERPAAPRTKGRWRQIVALHLLGKKQQEIADELGITQASVSRALNDERSIAMIQQNMQRYDAEFKALYPKVIDSIRNGLNSESHDVQKEARRDWLKAHGKFANVEATNPSTFSAEKMVFQILNQAKKSE